jgi:hypothetical protein
MKNINTVTNQEQAVIFIHIPKAGGTTLQRIIEKQYQTNNIFTIKAKYFYESIEEFKNLPEVRRREIRLLKGHMFFGLHKFLPMPCSYITILRNPIERIISHYYYVIQHPNHYLHQDVISHKMSLKDYVCSGISTELDNGQTRLLSGLEDPIDFGQCSVDILENAKNNLKYHFAVVGVLEKFNETLILMKKKFGWKLPLYIRANRTRSRPKSNTLSQETLKAITKYNQLDIQLYEYAEQLFEELILGQNDDFNYELIKFSLSNMMYQKTRGFYVYLFSSFHKK